MILWGDKYLPHSVVETIQVVYRERFNGMLSQGKASSVDNNVYPPLVGNNNDTEDTYDQWSAITYVVLHHHGNCGITTNSLQRTL